MTRLLDESFEFRDLTKFSGIASATISSLFARSGTYSVALASNGQITFATSDGTEFYIREGFYINGTNSSTNFLRLRHGTSNLIALALATGTNYIQGLVGATPVATGSHAVVGSTWNLLETYGKLADAGGRIVVYLNGIKEIDYTGDTKPGTEDHIDNIQFFDFGGSNTYLDDIAINDTSGTVDNSWCGDGHYVILYPDAEGDVQEWIPSSGTSHYTQVDEFPYDGDTTYVTTSGVLKKEMFNLSSFDDTNKKVTRIFPEMVMKDNLATAGEIKIGLKTGGNIYLESSGLAIASIYTRYRGNPSFINPVGSGAWTKTDLDAIQFVIESQ